MQIKINKGNWSGEETTLTYNEKTGEFTLACFPEEAFVMKKKKMAGMVTYSVFYKNHDTEYPVVTVYEGTKGWWEALEGNDYFNSSCSREATNRFIAAAQVLCTII